MTLAEASNTGYYVYLRGGRFYILYNEQGHMIGKDIRTGEVITEFTISIMTMLMDEWEVDKTKTFPDNICLWLRIKNGRVGE